MLDKNVIENCNYCSDGIILHIFIRQKKRQKLSSYTEFVKNEQLCRIQSFKIGSLQSALN